MGTVVVMVKTQIGLGVLSIPSAFDALGLIPGVICLLAVGGIITWGNHVVGVFKHNHPEVYSIVDVGEKIGGKIGKEVVSVLFMLCKYQIHRMRTQSDYQQGGFVSQPPATRVSLLLSTLSPFMEPALPHSW